MTLESERIRPGKQHVWLLELHVPVCSLVSGVGACSSTATGDDKCYNTEATCPVIADIQLTETKVYRFAQASENMPMGSGFIPSLLSVNVTPGQLRIGGGLGSRSAVTVTLADHPHSDIGIDPYRSERTADPFFRGSFWPKFRARNPYIKGSLMRVWDGYLAADNDLDSFDYGNAQSMDFLIESSSKAADGTMTITGKDPLKAADDDRSLIPRQNSGKALNAITAAAGQVITLDPPGIGNAEYPASGIVKIAGAECATFTRSGDSMTLTGRGVRGTTAQAHDADAAVQLCYLKESATVAEHARDMLLGYTETRSEFIPFAEWEAECDNFLPYLYDVFITTPTPVREVLQSLGTEAPSDLFWDERVNLIQLRAVKSAPASAAIWDDEKDFLESGYTLSELTDKRVSTVIVNFDVIDPTADLGDPNNYRQTYVLGDLDSARRYDGQSIKVINSRFFSATNRAAAEHAANVILGRFRNIPRQLDANLAAKNAEDAWTADAVFIKGDQIQDKNGDPATLPFQITSVRSDGDMLHYRGLEWFDVPDITAEFLIVLSDQYLNLRGPSEMALPPRTLRDLFDARFGVAPDSRTVRVRIELGAVNGSQSTGIAGLQILAAEWPPETPIVIEIMGNGNVNDTVNNGYFVGAGGTGGTGRATSAARHGHAGGPSMKITRPITLIHHGVIGGGAGGGGGSGYQSGGRSVGGGGGAGRSAGAGGPAPIPTGGFPAPGQPGSLIAGGNGGGIIGASGGRGGDLGEDGNPGTGGDNIYRGLGGAAGVAIDGWSFVTLDPSSTGVILGPTIN